jgi:alanyl-tRNA synthetase
VTDRIYYTDAYAREFDAQVVDVVPAGERSAAILDRTAFYPTSGGQPFDIGVLVTGDVSARVVDVVDRDDGVVLHVIEGAVVPAAVHGRIDWDRRFDHMQQHTGQHVLSAAFERVAGARTESFHLGSASSTIDLAREVSAADVAAAELEANQVVWSDRPVRVRFVDDAEARTLPLRKEPARKGLLRIVEIEDFDLSACGGTHVSRTGAIGNIAIAGSDRFRGGSRIEFRCGIRTMHGYRALREAAAGAARLLSTAVGDLPGAVERLQAEDKEGRSRLKTFQEKAAIAEAAALAQRARRSGAVSVVVESLSDWDANGIKAIAAAIAARPGHAAVLTTAAPPVSIVVARAADVPLDAAAIVKAVGERFGGRGGGRPEVAQGGGLNASAAEILSFALTLLSATND